MVIYIENDGHQIIATNYWQTELAQRGLVYVSVNAGAFRILLPRQLVSAIDDMQSAKYVIATRGTWYVEGTHPRKDSFEFMFEDDSDAPYSIHIVREQIDRLPAAADEGRTDLTCLVYTDGPKLELELPARYRRAKRLPCLQVWS